MADDVTGAVRRTPRPYPSTEDRQVPETAAQAGAGTTNEASPVPSHQDAVSSRVSSRPLAIYRSPASDALAIEREDGEFTCVELHPDGGWRGTGLIEVVPNNWVLARYQPSPDEDMEAYAALPECTACGGSGKDDHATVFEAPLAVHFAGPPVKAEGRQRQLCMWCGHVLTDVALTRDTEPPEWPVSALIKVEDGLATLVPHEPGAELPPGCCALPDDEGAEPVCPCDPETERCTKCADDGPDEAQETRAAADWPTEPVDMHEETAGYHPNTGEPLDPGAPRG